MPSSSPFNSNNVKDLFFFIDIQCHSMQTTQTFKTTRLSAKIMRRNALNSE